GARGGGGRANVTRPGTTSLDELRVLVVVDNTTDTLSSIAEGVPQTPEVAQHLPRVPVSRVHDGHPGKVVFDRLCCAAHGLSVLATGRRGEEERTILFDVGPHADIWLANAARLGVELATIGAGVISHLPFDPSDELPEVVAALSRARRQAGLATPVVVDLHPDRPDQRGTLHPNGTLVLLAPEPTFEAIEAAGGRVVKHDEAHAIADGFFFGSGRIDRV